MQFEIRAKLSPNLFYALDLEKSKPHYFYPLRQLDPQKGLFTSPYKLAENVYSNFSISAVGQNSPPDVAADIVGFLFKSNLPVANYRTSIMSFARSWQMTATKIDIKADELTLLLKDESFLVYHVPGKATLITSVSLSDALHDYLTMI